MFCIVFLLLKHAKLLLLSWKLVEFISLFLRQTTLGSKLCSTCQGFWHLGKLLKAWWLWGNTSIVFELLVLYGLLIHVIVPFLLTSQTKTFFFEHQLLCQVLTSLSCLICYVYVNASFYCCLYPSWVNQSLYHLDNNWTILYIKYCISFLLESWKRI